MNVVSLKLHSLSRAALIDHIWTETSGWFQLRSENGDCSSVWILWFGHIKDWYPLMSHNNYKLISRLFYRDGTASHASITNTGPFYS